MTPVEHAELLLSNPISIRLSEGWYPSRDTAEGIQHDRHVMIWVRQYESVIRDLVQEIERLTYLTNDA